MNHEAISFYIRQETDMTFSNSLKLSDLQKLEETVGEVIKKKFHINDREKIIDLIEKGEKNLDIF